MPTHNGPGDPYIIIPPPPPPPAVALYVPQSVRESATEEQERRIALIELQFAHRVSVLLSETYSEIQAVLRTEQR
jgi:hypothetical protein